MPWCLLEKGHRFGARPPRYLCGSFKGREQFLQLGCGRLSSACSRRPRDHAAQQPAGPSTRDLHRRRAARGWGAPLTPPGPARPCACRKRPLPSTLGPFPLAELLRDFIFIVSPPHSLCVVYVALAPSGRLGSVGFFPSSAGQMADVAKLGCRQRASCPSHVSAPGRRSWGRVLPERTAAHVPRPGPGPAWQGLPAWGLLLCRGAAP